MLRQRHPRLLVGTLDFALRHRLLFVVVAFVVLVISVNNVKPLIGQDVQPPMDTGILKINFEADGNSSLSQANGLLSRMEEIINKQEGVVSISATLGSEPSVVSFGSGKNPQQGNITINLVDRYHRKQTMWQIENTMRQGFLQLPGLKSADVFDYGATSMSSIRAAVDVMVTGPAPKILYEIGPDVKTRLEKAGGIKSVSTSWGLDKKEVNFIADKEKCALYGVSPKEIASQAQAALQGGVSSIFRVPGEDGFPVRTRYVESFLVLGGWIGRETQCEIPLHPRF